LRGKINKILNNNKNYNKLIWKVIERIWIIVVMGNKIVWNWSPNKKMNIIFKIKTKLKNKLIFLSNYSNKIVHKTKKSSHNKKNRKSYIKPLVINKSLINKMVHNGRINGSCNSNFKILVYNQILQAVLQIYLKFLKILHSSNKSKNRNMATNNQIAKIEELIKIPNF
jgi:hypothetical protein